MKIDCQECGARILAEDVDLHSSMAKCRNCNAVFAFGDKLRPPSTPQRERLRAPRPEGLDIREESFSPSEPGYRDAPTKGGSIIVTRKWFTPQFIFLAFFCVAWDGFLVFWYSNLGSTPDSFSIIAALFPIAHVAVGIGLTYYTFAGFINHTTLFLDKQSLSVRHGPLPWRGNQTISRDDIKQFYCEHEVTQGKNGPSHSYYLSAVLHGDRKVRLTSMPADQARYIEELFEDRLGLHDMAVPGEAGPNDG